MIKSVYIGVILLVGMCSAVVDSMAFVFELDRHGARAPTGTNLTLEFYDVSMGMLTP